MDKSLLYQHNPLMLVDLKSTSTTTVLTQISQQKSPKEVEKMRREGLSYISYFYPPPSDQTQSHCAGLKEGKGSPKYFPSFLNFTPQLA